MSNVTALRKPTAREMRGGIKIIDVDTHISEPWDLRTSRAPASLRDRMPRVKMLDGKRSWVIDGDKFLSSDCASCAVYADGSKERGLDFVKIAIPDAHAGAYDTKARVALIEVAQGLAPTDRDADAFDWLADTTACAVVIAATRLLRWRIGRS